MDAIETTTGHQEKLFSTYRAVHISSAIGKLVKRVPGDGAYTATPVLAVIVTTAPTSDNTQMIIDGDTFTTLPATMFPLSDRIPFKNVTSITVGTGGVFYLVIPD